MALNFPNAPIVGQVFEAEGATFVWNGSLWVVLSAASFPWATAAEAIAGARDDLAVSPLTTKAAIDARGYQPTYLSDTPVDVLASRAVSTDYQNDTDRPLAVAICFWNTTGAFSTALRVSSAPIGLGSTPAVEEESQTAANRRRSTFVIVPPGWWYRMAVTANTTILNWIEYRGAPT